MSHSYLSLRIASSLARGAIAPATAERVDRLESRQQARTQAALARTRRQAVRHGVRLRTDQ